MYYLQPFKEFLNSSRNKNISLQNYTEIETLLKELDSLISLKLWISFEEFKLFTVLIGEIFKIKKDFLILKISIEKQEIEGDSPGVSDSTKGEEKEYPNFYIHSSSLRGKVLPEFNKDDSSLSLEKLQKVKDELFKSGENHPSLKKCFLNFSLFTRQEADNLFREYPCNYPFFPPRYQSYEKLNTFIDLCLKSKKRQLSFSSLEEKDNIYFPNTFQIVSTYILNEENTVIYTKRQFVKLVELFPNVYLHKGELLSHFYEKWDKTKKFYPYEITVALSKADGKYFYRLPKNVREGILSDENSSQIFNIGKCWSCREEKECFSFIGCNHGNCEKIYTECEDCYYAIEKIINREGSSGCRTCYYSLSKS